MTRHAGAIPYRHAPTGDVEVLLITSRSTGRWIVPKGHLEPDLTPAQTAALEAREEAGAVGACDPEPLGLWHHPRRGGVQHVTLFALPVERVLDVWDEAHERQRRWLPLRHALDLVEPELARGLLRLAARLDEAQPGDRKSPPGRAS